jgi:hypothetical protein
MNVLTTVRRYTYELYSTANPRIVDRENMARMIDFTSPNPNSTFKFYGMGTFNLDWSIGVSFIEIEMQAGGAIF